MWNSQKGGSCHVVVCTHSFNKFYQIASTYVLLTAKVHGIWSLLFSDFNNFALRRKGSWACRKENSSYFTNIHNKGQGIWKVCCILGKALLNANEWITYNSLLPAGVISYDISQNCLFCKEQPSALFEAKVTRLKGEDYRMSNRRKSRTRTLLSYKKWALRIPQLEV